MLKSVCNYSLLIQSTLRLSFVAAPDMVVLGGSSTQVLP
jgi:hypothetical protein